MGTNEKGSGSLYLIGQAAEKVGLSAKTIRYYEETGVLPKPHRRSGDFSVGPGYRAYTEGDIERLRFVKLIRHLGLPLNDIKRLLKAVDQGCCGSARPQFLSVITDKLRQTDEQMRELRHLKSQLVELKDTMEQLPSAKKQAQAECPSSEAPSKCVMDGNVGGRADQAAKLTTRKQGRTRS